MPFSVFLVFLAHAAPIAAKPGGDQTEKHLFFPVIFGYRRSRAETFHRGKVPYSHPISGAPMPGLDHLMAVILKFLAPATLIERTLEFFTLVFETTGIFRGKTSLALRLVGGAPAVGELPDGKSKLKKQVVLQSIGIVLGVLLCWKGNLHLFEMLAIAPGAIPTWVDVLLSGLLISGGSQPIHDLITFLQKARENAKNQVRAASETLATEEKIQVSEPGFRKIEYNGGIYPSRPGHSLRRKNPSYIVVHHSATKNTLSFEEIVAIEKERRLDPSYHCVLTYDGTHHDYCRWDGVGYHVKRGTRISNGNSLGICFVGNYSTDSSVPGNNADGKFGPKEPSSAQLQHGAEMIALWLAVYDIPAAHIVPHRDVKKHHTDCPGNNFPVASLVDKATKVLEEWQATPGFTAFVREFRQKPFVLVPEHKEGLA